MSQEVVRKLVTYTQIMFSKLESGYLTTEKRYPANAAFTTFEILRLYKERVEPLDYVYFLRKFIEIYEKLIETTYSHFFGNLYQSLLSYKYRNYSRLEMQINWAIYDMEIMSVKISHSILNDSYEQLNDSLSNCFFDRVKDMIECDKLVIENPNLRRLWVLALYNSCTANKVLNLYLQTGKETYKEDLINLCQKISWFLSYFVNNCNLEEIHQGISLFSYILYNLEINKQFVSFNDSIQSALEKLKEHLTENYHEASFRDLCWMCVNLYNVDKDLFDECSKLLLSRLETLNYVDKQQLPQVVLALAYHLSDKDIGELRFDFPIDFNKVNFDEIFKIIFPQYLEAREITISNSDVLKLYDMYDSEIRNALARIIKTSDKIQDYIKQRLDWQKPHTGAEISDFELPIEIGGHTLYVCFPIKSGREILTTVPEKFIYQILRPFVHYKYCAVIFITAKKCSLNLKNMVEKYKDRFSVPVEILEDSKLAKLFKLYAVI